ncbi:hypothetical protein VN97_g2380 [Penicillium thymicola]|uniref:Uncharacterized protein n=1 Tax=Penicillium thymicola TaxID=293382 RepID=A0AAI9XBE1_PENTH|nr:hypothetical protein VN97_g2380 [Penicillium thymicola]
MSMVDNAIRIIREKEQNRIINFDHYSSSVWQSINTEYRSMRGAEQYDVSFETRFNGLSVLRKIGKTIALSSNDTLGHEVQRQFQWDASLVEGMLEILDSMTAEEILEIREDEASPESLWPKLQELEELANDYCIHPGLGAVLNRLDPGGHRDEEERDEEEHEEAYEDEENESEKNEDDVHQAQP